MYRVLKITLSVLCVSFIARGIRVVGRLITPLYYTVSLVLVAELAICILAHPFKDAIDSHLDSGLRERKKKRKRERERERERERGRN